MLQHYQEIAGMQLMMDYRGDHSHLSCYHCTERLRDEGSLERTAAGFRATYPNLLSGTWFRKPCVTKCKPFVLKLIGL